MKNIIIDLPDLEEYVILPSNEWKDLKAWLEGQDIAYRELSPDDASVVTDEETTLVYQIESKTERVESYFRNSSVNGAAFPGDYHRVGKQ